MDREELGGSQNSEQTSNQASTDSSNAQNQVNDVSLGNFQVNMNDGSVAEPEETVVTEVAEAVTTPTEQVEEAQVTYANSATPVEAPVANAAPVASPTEVPSTPQAVAPSTNLEQNQARQASLQKKSKATGIIIAVVAVIVLALGGLATWFFVFFNNPTKIVADAVTGLFSAEHLAMQGDISFEPVNPEDATEGVQKVWISFFSDSRRVSPSSYGGIINLDLANNDSLKLFFDYKIAENHNIYVKFSMLAEILEQAGIKHTDYPEAEKFFEVVNLIDDEWWEINVADLVKQFDLDTKIADVYDGCLDCSSSFAAAILRDKTFSKLYLEHSFLDIKESDMTLSGSSEDSKGYSVRIKPEIAADYLNSFIRSNVTDEYLNCVADELGESYDKNNISEYEASDISNSLPDDYQIILGINPWTHRLNMVSGSYNDDITRTTAKLEFTYKDIPFEVPTSYRPISDLIQVLQQDGDEIWQGMFIVGEEMSYYLEGDDGSIDYGGEFEDWDYEDGDYYEFDYDEDYNDMYDFEYDGEELEN